MRQKSPKREASLPVTNGVTKKKRAPHTPSKVALFQGAVWEHYKVHGRHDLPWRKTRHPYKILISEVMLQQTQVPRVIEKYAEFLRAFPSIDALAAARLSDVLKVWSGLGYNRRGKFLHDTAKMIVSEYSGNTKKAILEGRLPGVGSYTKAAVCTFAWNMPMTLVETNVRSAYLHHFFSTEKAVHDRKLIPYIEEAAVGQDPRTWYWALMDYGSHIKRLHKNPTRRSAHYSMQSKFSGSLREIRGAILRLLTTGSHGDLAIAKKLHFDERSIRRALQDMMHDGLVHSEKGSWRIA
jgi:A/G-specific adenine glycosylase